MRPLALLLALALAPPAHAQGPLTALFDDPTVWASASVGALAATPASPEGVASYGRDGLASGLSVTATTGRWLAQAGVQASHEWGGGFDFSGFDLSLAQEGLPLMASAATDAADPPYQARSFRTLYVLAGPMATSAWFMGGVAAGPAVTWGEGERYVAPPCDGDGCYGYGEFQRERYLNPGLAASVQGFVRLDGRVWVGGETMVVGNASSTHLATRLALRVDLRRPGQ